MGKKNEVEIMNKSEIYDMIHDEKVREYAKALPESIVLVDLIFYGWQKGRGPLHVVSIQDQKETFHYFKKQEAEIKKLEKALQAQKPGPAPPVPDGDSDGLDEDEDASLENYISLFELMSSFIQPPDLLIYLKSTVPNLVNQIQKRGREYEESIRIDYLKLLNERYVSWIEKYELGKLLIIDVDSIDFESKPEDLGMVIEKITAEIHGLF